MSDNNNLFSLIRDKFNDKLKNEIIVDNYIKAYSKINSPLYDNIVCAISGGADSDVMLDIVHSVDKDNKVKYVWFDTGLEFKATKEHLNYLEKRYNIKIVRERAIKPIPLCCSEYGQPFVSKLASKAIEHLQSKGFKWQDKPFEELVVEYCDEVPPNTPKATEINGKWYKGCVRDLKWWCNKFGDGRLNSRGERLSKFNINYNKWLKEFMIENPPTFKISSKCCEYAKKKVAKKYIKENDIDLNIVGVRKAEGGARSAIFKSCFSEGDDCDDYRPLFWYKSQDRVDYEKCCDIQHSDCYTKWGFKRTGCCGCPYAGKSGLEELEIIKQYEPNLYKAAWAVFGKSYEYTAKYYQFRNEMKLKERGKKRLF